jgi:PAS domain S-box-containing protein
MMREQASSFSAGERAVLERVATGAPLAELLEDVVCLIEDQALGMLCSILLLDPARRCVRHGAAPSLPPDYVRALDGSPIGAAAGSCGAAAYRGEVVVVSDIATHPNWADYRHLALPHGLRACWSSPILSPDKEVLGTFAMYYREVRGPNDEETRWVAVATHLASIAILRDRAQQSLQRSEARARQLARLYAVANAINEAIARMREPQSLYDFACRIAVEQGLAKFAWVGLTDRAQERVLPAARHGVDDGYLDAIALRLADERIKNGPVGRAVATGMPVVSNDIASDAHFYWKDAARQRGLHACAAFPLRIDARNLGVFVLYAEQPGYFRDEEVRVLTTLADDVSFALESAASERERRRMEEMVRASETLRALIYDSVEDVIFYLAVEGPERYRFLSVNRTFLAVTGLSERAVIGKPVEEVVPEPSRSLVLSKYREAIARRQKVSWDEATPYPKGLKHGEVTVSPIFDAQGRCTNLVGTVHDVTQRKQVEAALRKMADALSSANDALEQRVAERTDDLDEANRKLGAEIAERQRTEAALRQAQKLEAIGRLAGGVAHNFNNILTVVLSSLDIAQAPGVDEQAARSLLAAGQRAAERGARVTRQLLAFAGQQRLNLEVIDPSAHLREFVALMAQSLRGDIVIESDIPDGLSPVEIDPAELELAILNLGLNARDAMPNGGVVRVAAANRTMRHRGLDLDGDYVVIEISDGGSGIAPENLSRVFEPFFTTKDVASGSGLGLSQVHGFAKQSLGAVDIESEPGKGTTVRLYLPVSTKPPTARGEQPGRARHAPHAAGTVLVVEDDPDVAELAAALLRRCGFEVGVAHRARAALARLRGGEPVDLVFADILMPDGMNGIELAETMAQRFPKIPVLLASGYAEAASEAKAKGLHIMAKPYRADDLCARVQQLLGGRGA